MKRTRLCFHPKDSGTGKGKDTNAGPTTVSAGSDDEDTSFTLNVETFSFKELSAATANFSDNHLIGSGGSAKVYEGHLPDIGEVAIKRLSFDRNTETTAHLQRGFLREVFVLNSIKHPNIVRLIGCCSEGRERLLVYEHVYRGSLRKCLSELDWQKRMNIAFGAAKGLEELYLQVNPSIIHRDIKSDNILLSKDFEPKVSDFGSANIAPDGKLGSGLVGTIGYMAPEVANCKSVSVRSDIYSFGVVLLELITALKAIDNNRQGDKKDLASWKVRHKLEDQNNYQELLDPNLPGCVPQDKDLRGALSVAGLCTMTNDVDRPEIGKIVQDLRELAYRSGDHKVSSSSGA